MIERLRRPISVTVIPGHEFVTRRSTGSKNIIWVDRAAAHISIRMAEYQYEELRKGLLRTLRAANRSIMAPNIIANYDAHSQLLDFGFLGYSPANNDNAIKSITGIADNIRMRLRED